MLIRQVRRVPVGEPVGVVPPAEPLDHPVDLRVVDGQVREIAPDLVAGPDEPVLEAAGRWVVPGLWDAHVHLTQWTHTSLRLDLSGTASPAAVTELVRQHVADLDARGASTTPVVGAGFRLGGWHRPPTVAELDAVAGDHPVVLISGDVHNGWLSSAALRWFDLPTRDDVLTENDWFPVLERLSTVPVPGADLTAAYARCASAAAALGVVGVVDMEFSGGYREWPGRVALGVDQLRVRTAVYPDGLDEVITHGLRTGDVLDPTGLITLGPLKIISDGSVNTRTAWCCEPYADGPAAAPHRGVQNVDPTELARLLGRARAHGLQVAVHAIGDAAVADAIGAFAATGARGSIEHAQLVRFADLAPMARLGLVASVQPAHLLDDVAVTRRYWPDRTERCFAFASMLRAGVRLALGSDAPVSPLDPWLAMAAAVTRTPPGDVAWNPAESITAAQALAASTDGATTVGVGGRADLVLLDRDPLTDPGRLATTPVAATLLAGRITHLDAGLDRR